MLASLNLEFRRKGHRVWLRSQSFINRDWTWEETSDDDEPGDAYPNRPLTDKNWLARYEAERQKKQELDDLASVAISKGVEEEACSLLLLRCFARDFRLALSGCTQISGLSQVSFFLWEYKEA